MAWRGTREPESRDGAAMLTAFPAPVWLPGFVVLTTSTGV